MRLSDRLLEMIRRNRAVYEEAEHVTYAPWRMLATIHYLENDCDPISPGPGGPFQMDPPPSDQRLEFILSRYGLPLRRVEEDFLTAAVVAADHLQSKVQYQLRPDTVDEALVKDAFWGYNGRAYGSADNSPYVANDPPNRILIVHGTYINSAGVRVPVNRPFAKHGALFVWRELYDVYPAGAAAARWVFVDDGDASWEPWYRDHSREFVAYQDRRGRDFKYVASCAEGDTVLADWRPQLPASGRYRVDAYIPGVHGSTRQALYFVKGVLGDEGPHEEIVPVNQLAVVDEWVPLGEFEFDPAVLDSGVVRLTNYSPESPETEVAFDAVRWRLVES